MKKNWKKIIQILAVALMAATGAAQAQEKQEMMEEIKDQLSATEASEVTQAEEQVEKAKTLLEQVSSKQAQADKLRAVAKSLGKGDAKKKIKQAETIEAPLAAQKISAYNIYEKGNATIYGIFSNNIKELSSLSSSETQDEANSLTSKATDAWAKAATALKSVPTGKNADQKSIAKTKQDANQNQLQAIDYQIEAYKLLLELDAQPSQNTNIPAAAVVQNDTPIQSEDPAQTSTPQQSTSSPFNEDSFDDGNNFEFVKATNTTERIIYKVQIAADEIPLSIARLRQICPTDDVINNEFKNGVYRYTIGYYMNYDEAKEVAIDLQKRGVTGAFVVAYRNGVRIKEIRDVYNNN